MLYLQLTYNYDNSCQHSSIYYWAYDTLDEEIYLNTCSIDIYQVIVNKLIIDDITKTFTANHLRHDAQNKNWENNGKYSTKWDWIQKSDMTWLRVQTSPYHDIFTIARKELMDYKVISPGSIMSNHFLYISENIVLCLSEMFTFLIWWRDFIHRFLLPWW